MSNNNKIRSLSSSINNNNNSNDKNSRNEPTIRRRSPPKAPPPPKGFLKYAKDVTSQNGEDGIIERLFLLIPPTTRGNNRRWCVDVGAWDGIHLSNTRQLLLVQQQQQQQRKHQQDDSSIVLWNGVLIEADSDKFQQLHQLYNNDNNDNHVEQQDEEEEGSCCMPYPSSRRVVHCVNATVSVLHESPNTLTNILSQIQHKANYQRNNKESNSSSINQQQLQQPRYDDDPSSIEQQTILDDADDGRVVVPYDFDFLCIDIDGNDYWILYDLFVCGTYSPKVICIEFNPTMPYDMIYIPPYSDQTRHGCSLAALIELCEQYNYVLIATTLYNAFFVHRTTIYEPYLVDIVPDTSLEAIVPDYPMLSMGTSLYQLYDGTIKLWGCKKLLWHRIPIEEEKIQIIPKHRRTFPFSPSSSTTPTPTNISINHQQDFDMTQVVDISSYCVVDDESHDYMNGFDKRKQQQLKCSAALLDQLVLNDGFCYVRGTGMKSKLCDAALYWTNEFLHNASEDIRRSCLSRTDRARRGYSPINTENFASLLQPNSPIPNDLVRKFRIGSTSATIMFPSEPAESSTSNSASSDSHDNRPNSALLQPNIWPTAAEGWGDCEKEDANVVFQSTLEEYYVAASMAAQNIVRAICVGLLHQYPLLNPSLNLFVEEQNTTNLESKCSGSSQKPEGREGNGISNIEHGAFGGGTSFHWGDTANNNRIGSSNYSTNILTILGYGPNSTRHRGKQKGRPLVAAHTDVGIITMLIFDQGDCATLQRRNNKRPNSSSKILSTTTTDDSGENSNQVGENSDQVNTPKKGADTCEDEWIDITLPGGGECIENNDHDPIFVINIADCFSELTGGILRSTIHRIVPRPGPNPRNCCAMFVGLHPDQTLHFPQRKLDNYSNYCDTNDRKNNNRSVSTMSYEEWRKQRIARAQAVFRETTGR